MKFNSALFLFFVLISGFAFAQPSVTQIKADVKKQFPKATLIDVSAAGKTTKELESSVWQTIHRQNVNVTVPANNAKFPNAKWIFRGAVKYQKAGSGFSFVKFNPGDELLEGMPAPNKEGILTFLNANKSEIFTNKYSYLSEPQGFELVPTGKLVWLDFDRIQLEVTTTYEKITSTISTEKIKAKLKIIVYGKDGGSWTKAQTTGGKELDSEVLLEKKKYSVEELEKINTWGDQVDLKEAMVAWARIKPLTVPAFKTVFEAASFVNDILIEGDDMKVRSLMYYMSPSDAFKAPERKVFTRYGKERYEKIMTAAVNGDYLYKEQYCSLIDVKESTQSSVDVYNKDRSSYCRFEFGLENNAWKLTGATMYVLQGEVGTKLKSLPCTKTSLGTVERGTQQELSKLKVKDHVLAYYESDKLWYPAFYLGYENYYYNIQYFMDNSKGKVRKIVPMEILAGDKAFVKLQDGSLKEVTIKSVNGTDVVIDFNGQNTNYKMSGLFFK